MLLFDFIKETKASESIRLAGNFLNSFKTLMINGNLSAKRSRTGGIIQPQFSNVTTKSMICYNSSAFSSTLSFVYIINFPLNFVLALNLKPFAKRKEIKASVLG